MAPGCGRAAGRAALNPALDVEAKSELRRWAATGVMWLTGHPDGPPLAPDRLPMAGLEAATARLATLSAEIGTPVEIDIGVILTGRAAVIGLERRARVSAGGSCRLLRTADGWAAVNLPRPDDVAAVPAITGDDPDAAGDPWTALTRTAAAMTAAELVDRAQLLSVPAAALPPRCVSDQPQRQPYTLDAVGHPTTTTTTTRRPVVIDLSAMWAGPLCAHLLGEAGARVVKVESTRRPDGTRHGPAAFFDWLHAGHDSVALDLSTGEGRGALRALTEGADIVIESSRPRALAQLGVDAHQVLRSRPGTTWVSITGYGRAGAGANRVAFGDDAAIGAGLVAYDAAGVPAFCGDAIADPITGIHAALGALESRRRGGGHLVHVVMHDAVRHALDAAGPHIDRMQATVDAPERDVSRPRPPPVRGRARPLGADTTRVLAELVPSR